MTLLRVITLWRYFLSFQIHAFLPQALSFTNPYLIYKDASRNV